MSERAADLTAIRVAVATGLGEVATIGGATHDLTEPPAWQVFPGGGYRSHWTVSIGPVMELRLQAMRSANSGGHPLEQVITLTIEGWLPKGRDDRSYGEIETAFRDVLEKLLGSRYLEDFISESELPQVETWGLARYQDPEKGELCHYVRLTWQVTHEFRFPLA